MVIVKGEQSAGFDVLSECLEIISAAFDRMIAVDEEKIHVLDLIGELAGTSYPDIDFSQQSIAIEVSTELLDQVALTFETSVFTPLLTRSIKRIDGDHPALLQPLRETISRLALPAPDLNHARARGHSAGEIVESQRFGSRQPTFDIAVSAYRPRPQSPA
jgi:hypothetical protein